MKRITIRDIAKMLSVSPSTVSRALSDHPDISEATKQRVNEVANTFNYTVNLHSNFFRNRKSNLIALIVPEINMFFTPSIIKSINKTLAKTEYSLFVLVSNDKYNKEKDIIEQCVKWAVEGVLISLSNETKSINHLNRLTDFGIKTVLLDKIVNNQKYHSIVSDSFGSSYIATKKLIDNGHTQIVGVFGNPNLKITQQRITGFKSAIQENQLNMFECPYITSNKAKEIEQSLPLTLEQNPNVTAVFVMSDELLAKTHYILNMIGKRIYHDISLIAISDGLFPYILYPNVTYIKDSGRKLGKRAIRLLIDLLDGKASNVKMKTLLKTKLVELNSVKDIRDQSEILEENQE